MWISDFVMESIATFESFDVVGVGSELPLGLAASMNRSADCLLPGSTGPTGFFIVQSLG